jgi:hypothetical protein
MSDLKIESFKESHRILIPMEHEIIVVANTVNLSLYCFYLLYELLNYGFSLMGYLRLPVFSEVDNSTFGRYIEWLIRPLLIVGLFSGLLGAANWKVRYLLLNCIICSPFAIYDMFLITFDRFHKINVNDFLLFQTLLASTFRAVRIFTTLLNISFVMHRFSDSETLTF